MNIHEYQAKALLRSYGAPVSDGRIVLKSEDAKTAAGELDGPMWVVKAQIHAAEEAKELSWKQTQVPKVECV